MRKLVLGVVATVVVVGAVFLGRALLQKSVEVPRSFRLTNGLEAEVVPIACGPNATATLLFSVGTNQDPPGQSGLMRVVERLLMSTSSTGVKVQTLSNATLLSVTAPREQLLPALGTVARDVMQPSLTENALGAAKAAVLADIAKRAGADASLAAITDAAEAVLPAPGNGRRGGLASEVQNLEPGAIQAFWQEHLTAGNARIVLVGEVDGAKAQAEIENAFGKFAPGTVPPARPPREMTVTGTLVMGDAPASVAIAVRAPGFTDKALASFLVLAARLIGASDSKTWSARYDPVLEPELLYVTGPLTPGEQPEAGAARIRALMTTALERPLASSDVAGAKERFQAFLNFPNDKEACAPSIDAFALARARRTQQKVDPAPIVQAMNALTPAQMAEDAAFFAPNRVAAVIAGGAVR